ncbi:MAG TPA: hypothetical protein VGB43_08175 [Flavobacterium sp.]
MSGKKKQFGVWMDNHHATITGRENIETGEFVILGHVKNSGAGSNSSEKSSNNHEQGLTLQFFKSIASHMQNVDEIFVTGTGDAQEEFIRYLSETPQYKNTVAHKSTSNKLGDEQFVDVVAGHFN